jgi:hypothetical protein
MQEQQQQQRGMSTTSTSRMKSLRLQFDAEIDLDDEQHSDGINAINSTPFRWALFYFYFCLGVVLTFPGKTAI